MRIALFHNYMDNIGGAERVTLTLARELHADVYTTVFDKEKIKKMGFDIDIKTIGWIPVNAPFRQQLASLRFRRLNLKEKYDFFIIAGDWALSAAIHNKPNLWIAYSPPREIWDLYEYTRKNNVGWWGKQLFDGWVIFNRQLTKKYVSHVDKVVSISDVVKKRVEKYLQKDSAVLYPPVDIKKFFYKKNGDFWLSVNRLIHHKRVAMQIDAFKNLPHEKLVIVGSFEKSKHFIQYKNYIMRIKPKNVTIKSWVDQQELIELYATCKGFITTSKDEDFGLNAVEAMASGKPVVAPNEGGYRETVLNGKTGILIDKISSATLKEAIIRIDTTVHTYKTACLEHAKKFDTKHFLFQLNNLLANKTYASPSVNTFTTTKNETSAEKN